MKIAIDITQAIYGTGVSVYTRNLIDSMIKLFPHDNYLLFGGSLRRRHELVRLTDKYAVEKRFFSLPPRLLDLLWNSLHILPVERLIGNVDIVHTSDWAEPPSSHPKVTTVHDLIPFKYPQATAYQVRSAHKKKIAWVIKESKAIIAVSQTTKKDLLELLKVPEERIHVVYEGVEDRFSPQPPVIVDAVKRKHRINGDYLFSLSTLEPRKNQARLIESFARLKVKYPNITLVIGGRTGWGESIKPIPGVIMPGFIDDNDLPALYSGCLAYVLPSLYEGFSLSHLQAMACGAPVVGSNVSSMPEVIDKAGILVNPNDTEAIVLGIIEAINKRPEYIKKSLNRAKRFSWADMAGKTHEIYEQVSSAFKQS